MKYTLNQLGTVWGVDDIAQYLRCSKGYTRGLVNRPGFPTPITPGSRCRRWFADEVLDYLRTARTESPLPPAPTFTAPAISAVRPRNISTRRPRA